MTPWPVSWSERELSKLALTFRADSGYHGMRQAELEPQPTGTRVTVVERATIDSPLGCVMARLFFDPQTFAEVYLQAFRIRQGPACLYAGFNLRWRAGRRDDADLLTGRNRPLYRRYSFRRNAHDRPPSQRLLRAPRRLPCTRSPQRSICASWPKWRCGDLLVLSQSGDANQIKAPKST